MLSYWLVVALCVVALEEGVVLSRCNNHAVEISWQQLLPMCHPRKSSTDDAQVADDCIDPLTERVWTELPCPRCRPDSTLAEGI